MDKIIGVVGLGYVGLPLALTAVESGWNVIGFDKNSNLVRNLTSGESHIDDVSNERLLVGLSGGKFLASDDPAALSNNLTGRNMKVTDTIIAPAIASIMALIWLFETDFDIYSSC
jgi:UDP-N-acetyl-D-mannosaminuronate dehydrogenase